MRYRERRRVDWNEEIRKTERIRRRGFFISVLGFGLALIVVFGINRVGVGLAELSRKIIFALCFVLSMFLVRIVLRRRERLKLDKREKTTERTRLEALKREE